MARRSAKAAAVAVEPASVQEVRAYLLEHEAELPEGVSVAARGRLSVRAREFFTEATGRPVASV